MEENNDFMEEENSRENKKRSLYLTLIAVVTLLTAVVGATYAYFTFTATISSSTNTITSTTGNVGNVTLTATTSAMHITTDAYDFRQNGSTALVYWATKTSGSDYAESEELNTINTLVAGTGAAGNIYECTYTLAVTTTGIPTGITAGDYIVYIKGIGSTTTTLDMATAANRTKTYTVKRYLSGTTAKTLKASAKLTNRAAAQDYLQGQTITTTFTTSNLSCTLVASAGTETIS